MRDHLEGGCACGALRYRLTSTPMFVHCCHCRDCQRQTGSAFVINALIETDRVIRRANVGEIVRILDGREVFLDQLRCAASIAAANGHNDMALWDAIASSRPLPAYDSRGLGLMEPGDVATEAERQLAKRLKALKLRLGYSTLAEDPAALDAVRSRVGTDIEIMVDYDQALTPAEALNRCYALDHRGIFWIEEPIAHDDQQSSARLAAELRTAIQTSENFNEAEGMLRALKTGACPRIMSKGSRARKR